MFSLVTTGATLAYKVNYGGRVIATVKNIDEYDSAVKIVEEKLHCESIEEKVELPDCSAAIVLNDAIDTKEILADAIIECSEEIITGQTLIINGETVANVKGDELGDYLDLHASMYAIEGADNCTYFFQDNVEIIDGCFFSSDLDDIEIAKNRIDTLTVKTVATVVTDEQIPYKTVAKKTGDYMVGFRYTLKTGSNGIRRHTQTVTYINGVEQSREDITVEEISEAVDEVILVGTAKTQASAAERAAAHNSGFIFPLPSGKWLVTSYYGDGRSHKGVDLAAKNGVSIYAVADGVVSFSGTKSGYGYVVIIDHGNGTQTLYAHASALCVSKGETVSAGDVIALVGSTGNSTGNHLHFEVIKGGVHCDPAPYIGLD